MRANADSSCWSSSMDNGMSITPNVGAVADHLARQRLKPQYLTFKKHYRRIMNSFWLGRRIYQVTHRCKQVLRQSLLHCSMFENMGFNYLGPVDGHDLARLTSVLRYARELDEPVLLHVKTVKGKGYLPAEENLTPFMASPRLIPSQVAPERRRERASPRYLERRWPSWAGGTGGCAPSPPP